MASGWWGPQGGGGALKMMWRCVLGARAGLGRVGFRVGWQQEGGLPTTGVAVGSSKGFGKVITALSTLLSNTQNLHACANIAMALFLSQLFCQSRDLRAKISAMNSGNFVKQ